MLHRQKFVVFGLVMILVTLILTTGWNQHDGLVGKANASEDSIHIQPEFPDYVEIVNLEEIDPFSSPLPELDSNPDEPPTNQKPTPQEEPEVANTTETKPSVQDPQVDTVQEFKQDLWLSVPKMGVNTRVLDARPWEEKWDHETGLPQHFKGGRPDTNGTNVSIGGHRASHGNPFYYIHLMEIGDLIHLEYGGKRYTYSVYNALISSEYDWNPTVRQGFSSVTLMSCHPIGSDTHRYFVQAKLINVEE